VKSLERLLGEELSDPERKHIEAHVEDCTACRESLNRLALSAPGPAPAHLPSALSEAPPQEAIDEAEAFLHQLKQRVLRSGSDGGQTARPGEGESAVAEPPDVAGYEIQAELGRGAVGVVYRARHRELNRPVALKVIMAGPHLSLEARQRFRVEARAIARLHHPNIVQVYDVGEQSGYPYLALELVEGQNLARWLGGVPHPAADAARIIATLAGAVDYAHRQGVIHRDLKPANVLLAADGTAKITDFGLAKLLPGPGAAEDRMTQSGIILGTPAYIAPEQARGQAGEAGPAADIYSLGAMLYELLTGRPPFHGTSPMETLLQAAHQEPVQATRLVPRVPRDLDTICLRCLEKDAQKRYTTAGELAADLERFLNHEPILARPVGRLERSLRWVRRRPARAAMLGGSLLLGIALVAGGLWLGWQRAATVRAVEGDLREVAHQQREFSWIPARAALERAEARLGQAGPAELHRRLNLVRRDLDLVARLDAIRLNRATVVEGHFNNARADREYAEAFREAGLGEVYDDPEGVAARVARSPVRWPLVASLDDWAVCATDEGRQSWLVGVARRADRDPWRDRVRDPVAWGNKAVLAELARTAPVAKQSVQLLVALGERLRATGGDATGFLRRVQLEHPADFWTNFRLGNALESRQPGEAVGYYRAALAIRPGVAAVYYNLGNALKASGR
jgi:serine/threonine-protein kinase